MPTHFDYKVLLLGIYQREIIGRAQDVWPRQLPVASFIVAGSGMKCSKIREGSHGTAIKLNPMQPVKWCIIMFLTWKDAHPSKEKSEHTSACPEQPHLIRPSPPSLSPNAASFTRLLWLDLPSLYHFTQFISLWFIKLLNHHGYLFLYQMETMWELWWHLTNLC